MTKTIKIIWLLQFIIASLLITGVVPVSFAYLFLLVLVAGIWKLSDLEALQLYIFTIPIFVAMPASSLSDAMSVWRLALLFFIVKVILKRFDVIFVLRRRNMNFSGKKQKLGENLAVFWEEVKISNYYKLAVSIALFFGVGFFSLIFAQSVGAGLKKIIFLGSVFMLFGIIWSVVRSKGDLLKIIKSVYASGVFILTVGYFQLLATFFISLSDFWGIWDNYVINAFYGHKTMVLLSYSNTWFSYYDKTGDIPPTLRMFSVMPDSHSFSVLMILFAPLALFFAFRALKQKCKITHIAVFVLMLLAIFFSGSRGAWVGWLGALFAALYFYFIRKIPSKLKVFKVADHTDNRKMFKIILASVLTFIVLFPVCNFVLSNNQDSQLIREGKAVGQEKLALLKRTWSISDMDETSNKGRMEIWKDSATSVVRHPITGIGMGNFPLALSEKVTTSKMGASAHNIYLDVAVEMGVFGLLAFLFILYRLGEKLFRLSQKLKEKSFRLLAGSALVYFIWIFTYGFFDVVIFNDRVLMFAVIILALLYKAEAIEEKETAGINVDKI